MGSGWTTKTLDAAVGYKVHHKVEGSVLHLYLEADTTGWLGFGFAEKTSGHMKGADMVTAAVVNGEVRVEDRYAAFASTTYSTANYVNGYSGLTAAVDDHADWTIISGGEADGHTFVWVSRELVTADAQDRPVIAGWNRIVYAYGATDAVGYHGATRGSGTEVFFGDSSSVAFPAYDGVWTETFDNYVIPTQITTYACQSFTFPSDANRHIVAIRPRNVTKYNHHAILHVCKDNDYHADHAAPQLCSYHATDNPNPSNGQGSSPLASTSAGCSGLIWSWAVGMGDFIIPPEAGMRTGSGAITHVVLEMHYDNPDLDVGVTDSMGFDAFYTNTLRANDAAMIILGDPIVAAGNTYTSAPYATGPLPAGQTLVHRQATCPGECTQDFNQNISVFAHFLHMHYYGHKIYTEKYSKTGAPLGVVGDRIDFWDNAYQLTIDWAPYTIAPGETLQTHCFFDTAAMVSEVTFGTPTSSEMCQDFVFYYPAQFRGVNSNGDPEPFAMCGLADAGGVAKTVCGSLSQPGYGYLLDGYQEDKGTGAMADPDGFGVANLSAQALGTVSACDVAPSVSSPGSPPSTPPPPPVPSPPPSPGFPPGTETVTLYNTKVELVAAGTVADVTPAKQASIASVFAAEAGVDVSAVEVDVRAASVLISVVISSADATAASAVESALASSLSSSAAATSLLSGVGLTVIATPDISSEVVVALAPADGPADRTALYLTHAIFMSLAFALVMPSAMAFPLFLRTRLPSGRWLKYHQYTQYVALTLCTAGLVVAIVAVGQIGSPHFSGVHKLVGLITVLLSFSQVGLALVRPHAPKSDAEPKEPIRRAWEILHKGTAATIPVLAIVQLVSGVSAGRLLGAKVLSSMYAVFFVCASLAALFWAGAFYAKMKLGSNAGPKSKFTPAATSAVA